MFPFENLEKMGLLMWLIEKKRSQSKNPKLKGRYRILFNCRFCEFVFMEITLQIRKVGGFT